jgi:uncharacterized protein YuzE
LNYDPRYNVGYIRFGEKGTEVEAIRLGEEIVVDMAPDGPCTGLSCLTLTSSFGARTRAGSWS